MPNKIHTNNSITSIMVFPKTEFSPRIMVIDIRELDQFALWLLDKIDWQFVSQIDFTVYHNRKPSGWNWIPIRDVDNLVYYLPGIGTDVSGSRYLNRIAADILNNTNFCDLIRIGEELYTVTEMPMN